MAFNNTHTDILIAGALAAFSIDLLVYPIDTIKTRIQSPDYATAYKNASGTVNRALFRGLYQGVGSVILATVPSAGAFFTTYEASKATLLRLNQQLSAPSQVPTPIINSIASCTGELVSCLILTPAEVLKQNAQVLDRARAPASAAASAASHKPLLANSSTRAALQPFFDRPTLLFRGYTALVARNLPFTGLHFPLYEYVKARIHAQRKANKTATGSLLESACVTALSAGSAGSLAAFVTTPIDVVKTRIMLGAAKEGNGSRTATSSRAASWRVGREVWRTDGVRGLFRGAALRSGWTAIGSGLYLGIYESGRSYLESRRVGN